MINSLVDNLAVLMKENLWLAPMFAFLVGLITSFTPCCLSNISLVVSYVSGTGNHNAKRAFRLSLTFALGSVVTFCTLGVIASLIGDMMEFESPWWYFALGILMVLMALQIFDLYHVIPSTNLMSKNTKRGYVGAFFTGVLGGLFSSSCATPVLVVLLAMVAENGNLVQGVLILLLYSIGHSILTLIAGTSIGFVQGLITSDRYSALSKFLKIAMGTIVLLIAFVMFYLALFHVHHHV